MKKVVLLTSSPVAGGNGDALMEAAENAIKDQEVQIERINLRDWEIHPCRGCYGCRETGVCVQKDGFEKILQKLHECDALIAEAPIYYNCVAAQMVLAINRLCCTFACKTYEIGPQKKVAVMLTCTGSDVEEMKHHIYNFTSLPSLNRCIADEWTEVFVKCGSHDTCRENAEYRETAEKMAKWAIQ